MPAKSKSQLRYLFAKDPALGKEFAEHTPNIKALPEKVPPHKARRRKK